MAAYISTTVLTAELAKRTQPAAPRFPLPPGPPNYTNYAELFAGLEQDGWIWRFIPHHYFSPIYTSSLGLFRFFDACMAIVAARMLANAQQPGGDYRFRAYEDALTLQVHAYERCAGCGHLASMFTFELMYYLLLYFRNHAARGFAGTGMLILTSDERNGNRVIIRASLRLRDSSAQGVQRPCRSPEGC
ncbi:MAG: hypothetical protein Q9225_001082 [Loekoesia sp. 1 TL-2023]